MLDGGSSEGEAWGEVVVAWSVPAASLTRDAPAVGSGASSRVGAMGMKPDRGGKSGRGALDAQPASAATSASLWIRGIERA